MDNGSKIGGAGAAGRTTAQASVTPDFKKPGGIAGVPSSNAAADSLKKGEDAVVGATPEEQSEKDNLDGARADEAMLGSYYSGDGKDDEDEGKVVAVKKGPIASAIALILFVIGLVGGGVQFLQPVNLVERLTAEFNTMQTFNATRSNGILRYQLNNKLMKNPIKKSFLDSDKFKISDKQKTKLAKQGITLEGVEGTNTTIMRYNDNTGKVKYVVADEADIGSIKAKLGEGADVVSFRSAFETDATFFAKYKSASMTWRGAVANWFESGTMRFLKENKLTRNLFKNYKDEVAENGGDPEKAVNDLITRGTDDLVEEGGELKTVKRTEEEVDGGKAIKSEITETSSEKVEGSVLKRTSLKSESEVETKIKGIAKKYGIDAGSGAAGIAQTVTNAACIFFTFLGAVNMLVVADETLQAVHIAMGYQEPVSKMEAGDDGGELSAMMNKMNKVTTTTHKILKKTGISDFADKIGTAITNVVSSESLIAQVDEMAKKLDAVLAVDSVEQTGSAMDSEGIRSILSHRRADSDDPGISKFNFSRSYHTFLGAMGLGMGSFTTCMWLKIATNAAGVVTGAIEAGSCIAGIATSLGTFGVSAILGCAGLGASLIGKVALGIGVSVIVGALVTKITPLVAQVFMKNFAEENGIDLGNLTWIGSQNYLGGVSQANGNSLLTKDKYVAFRQAQQEVIAEDARYERTTKSPFDTSSQHTFMGTLVRQLANFAGTNSIMSALTNSTATLSSSLIAMTPAASAYDAASQLYDNYLEICPELANLEAVGSAACVPYRGSDTALIDSDPSEYMQYLADQGAFKKSANGELILTEDGNVIIDEDSELADFIRYGIGRTSGFGIADQSISGEVMSKFATVDTESSIANNAFNGAIGSVPFIGDGIDVVNSAVALKYAPYVDGEIMVPEGKYWEEHGKYNQIFIEDQSLFESEGIIGESAVAAFIEKEREENPLDNSYEGILARYSGLEKEDVVAILDILEYANAIAKYDPTTRYAFGQDFKPEGATELKFDNDQKVAYVVLLNTIEFADVRNRNFVV